MGEYARGWGDLSAVDVRIEERKEAWESVSLEKGKRERAFERLAVN